MLVTCTKFLNNNPENVHTCASQHSSFRQRTRHGEVIEQQGLSIVHGMPLALSLSFFLSFAQAMERGRARRAPSPGVIAQPVLGCVVSYPSLFQKAGNSAMRYVHSGLSIR